MSLNVVDEHWVPEHVKGCLREFGSVLPWTIRSIGSVAGTIGWGAWGLLRLPGLCSYLHNGDQNGVERVYEVHRRSIHPAMRVCRELGYLLLHEDAKVVSENQ